METKKETSVSVLNTLQETIFVNLTKAESIVNLLLLANQNVVIEQSVLHGAVWAVDDYISELRALSEKIARKYKNI